MYKYLSVLMDIILLVSLLNQFPGVSPLLLQRNRTVSSGSGILLELHIDMNNHHGVRAYIICDFVHITAKRQLTWRYERRLALKGRANHSRH